jgi:L-arabinose isomerase
MVGLSGISVFCTSTGDFESLCIIDTGGRWLLLCRVSVDPNSPTPQLPKCPAWKLANLSATPADAMMHIGSHHSVIRCLCAILGRLFKGLGMEK